MEWTTLITAILASGVITAIVNVFGNRNKAKAEAASTSISALTTGWSDIYEEQREVDKEYKEATKEYKAEVAEYKAEVALLRAEIRRLEERIRRLEIRCARLEERDAIWDKLVNAAYECQHRKGCPVLKAKKKTIMPPKLTGYEQEDGKEIEATEA